MWNGVPAPASVTSCCWIISIVLAGSKRSMYTVGKPYTSALNSQPMPPMWVNGNTTAFTSASVISSRSHMPTALGLDRAVGVQRALRVGGGARRVEVPAHGVVARVGRRRERGRVALRQRLVGDEHLERTAALGRDRRGDALGHRLEVEARPRRRHDEQLALGLARDEADLALAVDREHRVLDGAEPGQREHEELALEPRRQLPRHDVARADAVAGQPGGGPLGLGLGLGPREGAPVLVDRRERVGRGRGALLDELPEAPSVHVRHVRCTPGDST